VYGLQMEGVSEQIKVPVKIYFSDADDVTNASDNMDINTTINSLIGLPASHPETHIKLSHLFNQTISNPNTRVTIISAHGDELGIPPEFKDTMWVYTDQKGMPNKVSNLVETLENQTDILFLAICNPGNLDIESVKYNTVYPHGNINGINDNPDSFVCLQEPVKIN
jgi:hypothetical protein